MRVLKSGTLLACAFAFAATAFGQPRESIGDRTISGGTGAASPFAVPGPYVPKAVLLDNFTGMFVTNPTGGSGGAPISELRDGHTTYGFGMNLVTPVLLADDFVVPAGGWSVSKITLYGYQTGSTTTSTITALRLEILNGPPPGGTVVWGDLTTNVLASTTWTGVYRVNSTTPTDTTRPVMSLTVNLPNVNLAAGTYWMVWEAAGSLASGPWDPPITIAGQAATGNALQNSTGTWGTAIDAGTSAQQGFPFIIEGVATPVDLTKFSAN